MPIAALGLLAMGSAQKEGHGKLEIHRDYVCLPLEIPELDWATHVLGTPMSEMGDQSIAASNAADQRLTQELLSASLRSSGSAFIFPSLTPLSHGQRYVRVACIEETQAYLGNEAGLATLIASVPLPALVAPLLHKPFFGRKWDAAKQSDHWLASDGTTIVSLTISGASAAAVARMRLRFDDLRLASPGLLPSRGILHDLLEEIGREAGRDARTSPDGG